MSILEQVRSTMVGVFSNKKLLIFVVLAAIFIAAAVWVYNNYVKPSVDKAYVPNKEFIQKEDVKGTHADLYFFYTTWCPHCKTARPIWDEFKKENAIVNGVKINYFEVDCDTEKEVAQEFNIKGYPTIKLKYGNQVAEYDAKPDPDTLKQFLDTYLAN